MDLLNSTITKDVSSTVANSTFVPKKHAKSAVLFYFVIVCSAVGLMVGAVYQASPAILAGYIHWATYFDLQWAHEARLISILVDFVLMLWLVGTGLFWGVWLLHRSIRKLKGLSWSLDVNQIDTKKTGAKKKRKRFFPPIMRYLQVSCVFLIIALIFVIAQYPLQFIYSSY